MKRALLLLGAALFAAARLSADDIYQANAQGRRTLVQRHAIVVTEDSSALVYKHFDLKERRVVRVRLNQGSLPYSVDRSSPTQRAQIVEVWKTFGFRARVTGQDGKVTRVGDAFLDFYPPGGRGSLLESVPPRTNFPILLEGGGADQFEFSDLARVEFRGETVKLTLKTGQVKSGKFLMPTDQPAEARFLGISDHYDPASPEVFDFFLPLSRIREIQFDE